MSVIEVNEAFASAPIALMREFGIEDDGRVNPNGGACALGHPVGASGARLVGTMALETTASRRRATGWRPSVAAWARARRRSSKPSEPATAKRVLAIPARLSP